MFASIHVFLFRNRDVIFNNRKLVFRYGMMYSGFRQERWWWDGITLLRKFVMILIVTFARSWKRQRANDGTANVVDESRELGFRTGKANIIK